MDIPVYGDGLFFKGLAVDITEARMFIGKADDFFIFHIINRPGILQDGGNVGSNEFPGIVYANDQRAVLAGSVDVMRMIQKHDAESIGALYAVHDLFNRFDRITAVIFGQHVCKHLCVCFGYKTIALLFQTLLELFIVFDNAVMDDSNGMLLIHMGMRICVGGTAMGRPAGVSDTAKAGQQCTVVYFFIQNAKPADCLFHMDFLTIKNGDSGRVIASVFQLGKPIQNDGGRLLFSDITCNSTHDIFLLS